MDEREEVEFVTLDHEGPECTLDLEENATGLCHVVHVCRVWRGCAHNLRGFL